MPPRLTLRPASGRGGQLSLSPSISSRSSVCLFCSLTRRPPPRSLRKAFSQTRRAESTTASPSGDVAPPNARKELEQALLELQQHASSYVNLSRVQLAIRNLKQSAGQESIRIAILGMSNNGNAGRTAKELLRLVLADPLEQEGKWEQELEAHDTAQPLIIRVAHSATADAPAMEVAKSSLLPEVTVSSPGLNGHGLEILVMELNPFASGEGANNRQATEEAILVPTVDIPTSSTGRFTQVTTPVHKALVVTDGILGAAVLIDIPLSDIVTGAVNLRKYEGKELASMPIIKTDIEAASEGLAAFRKDIGNAIAFEHLWTEGNLGAVSNWLKTGVATEAEGTTKEAVRALIASLLQNTTASLQEAEANELSAALNGEVSAHSGAKLNAALAEWAQQAHAELQEQLDVAFTGRRWRKLGWWKLFWRVDDVGMLSGEMLAQRFLPEAERGIIYLAGRIEEAGITDSRTEEPIYPGPVLPPPASDNGTAPTNPTSELKGLWPTHIPYTRNYLLDTSIPALQALAQRLVVQTVGTSGLTTSLAVLVYLSSYGVYEAGAVAALGITWSLRRLQKKWEKARDFWQGEVREEGRKAVRGVEASVAEVLDRTKQQNQGASGLEDLRKIRQLVNKAEDALSRLR